MTDKSVSSNLPDRKKFNARYENAPMLFWCYSCQQYVGTYEDEPFPHGEHQVG